MTDSNEKRLGVMFVDWVARLPHEEVVRRYRMMPLHDRIDIEGYAFEESGAALRSDEPYGDRFEVLARCFDVFADAEDAPGLLSSENLLRERAHELRHPDESRKEHEAAAKRSQMSQRRLHALALASSCLADDAPEVRLRRIEEVLPQLKELAKEAVAEGNLREQSAIGADIAGLWKLRDALREGT